MIRNNSRSSFLEPIPDTYYENPHLCSFDVYAKDIRSLPVKEELISRITKARFANCQLTALPSNLEEYPNIKILEIIENQISCFPEDSFSALQGLTTLDLTANQIKRLDCKLPASLVSLNVSYNPHFEVDSVWAKDLPNLMNLKMNHCNICGLPSESPSYVDSLKSLCLDGNNLTKVPEVISNFNNLEELSLFGNRIDKLNLRIGHKLKILNLYYNELNNLDGDDYIIETQSLNLNSNHFKAIPMNVLSMNGLKILFLANCEISGELDFVLPNDILALDFSHNKITKISDSCISSMSNLSLLNLSYNSLTELPDCFPNESKLNKLFLQSNMFEKLPSSLLNNATKIEYLNLSSNKLKSLETFNFPQLRSLNISSNNISELSDSFRNCNFLTEFYFSFNNLSDLPNSLSNCRKMMFLSGCGNNFLFIPHCIFAFSQLKSLMLSGNKLTTLPKTIGLFFFLKSLDLSNNYFQTIPPFISQLRSLKYLSFSHNALQDFPDDFVLPKSLVLVDFSFNKLTKFNCLIPEAQSINLGYNLIESIDYNLFPKVQFLCLSHNHFSIPLVDVLGSIYNLDNLKTFEYIGNEHGNVCKPPPMRIHILSDFYSSVCKNYGIGYSATMGERQTMEDAVALKSYDDKHSVYAIFDGHSGIVSSSSAAICLINELQSVIKCEDNELAKAFSECFKRINQKLRLINATDGCTAAAALFRNKHCYITGVGDSRIVRIKKHEVKRMTVDYKPLNRAEYQRLRECGLSINDEGRINRKLAVARALGDFWVGDGIFVQPEVNEFDVDDDDIGLIIACDGLWDVITDEHAGDIVRNSDNAADAAVKLKNYAFALGSKDNISVIVIFFKPHENDCGYATRNTVELMEPYQEREDNDEFQFQVSENGQAPITRRRRR